MSPTATMTGPACIVMSPTATQSGHHVFSFPFDAPSTLRPQSTSSATSSTTLIHVSTSAASSTTVTQNLHFASLQETAVEVTSSGSSHQDTYVKSGHPSRSNNASEQENGSSASTHLDIYSGGQEGRHGRCLSVETELPPSCNGSRRGSAQLSRPIEVKETLNASVTKTAHGKMVGQYVLKRVLGQGAYGIVHLGYNVEDHDNFVRTTAGDVARCIYMSHYSRLHRHLLTRPSWICILNRRSRSLANQSSARKRVARICSNLGQGEDVDPQQRQMTAMHRWN